MFGWMMDDGWPFWWILWFLVPLLLIGIVVLLVIVLIRSGGGGAPGRMPPVSAARDLLDQRYARGEIDHDEYRRRRDELGGANSE